MRRRFVLLLSALLTACQAPPTGPAEANKELARRFVGAIDANDFEGLRAMVSEDFLLEYAGMPELLDVDQTFELIRDFYSAFPDYTHEIDEIVAEGDEVVLRITYFGTHTGEFEGVPADGAPIQYTGVQILTIREGKISEAWVLEDNLELMSQLGMTLVPAGVES